MINKQQLNDILIKNITDGGFALITFNNKTIPVYFSKQCYKGEVWFTESPCEARGFEFEDTENNIKNYVLEMYECESEEDFNRMVEYTKSMIRNGYLYDLDAPQILGKIIPNEIDEIKFITESECLDFMLENNKGEITLLY